MKHFKQIIFLLMIVSLVVSCKKKEPTKVSESDKKEVVKSKFAKNYPDFNPLLLQEILQLNTQNDSILKPYYETMGHIPVWVHDTLDSKKLSEFINILNNAKEHGLSSELFSASRIKSLTDSIDSGYLIGNLDSLYTKIAVLEQLATKAAIKYIVGMEYGFLNPKELYKKNYDITIATPDSLFFNRLYADIKKDPITSILNSHPKDAIYQKLLEKYKALESKKEKGFKEIKVGDVTYKVGDKSKHISEIAERLMLTGEYTPDPTSEDSLHLEMNEELLAAINTFRRQNSYPEEKEIGKLTVDALNRPFEYYQKKIHANMERYRWRRTKKVHNKNIEVNVASAILVATQPDSLPLVMKVCVGSIRNKTPFLQSDISYMNLNPVWNVPKSIAQNEIAVLQKKDPTYIKRHNMKLFKGGKEVEVSSIDWKDVNPSKFSYTIRQNSGNGNSLGLIKFMFNNAFSVYLHDTPNKVAFSRKNRAVSHGCVRVQKPFDLAFFCSSPVTDIYKDQLYYSVNKEPVSKEGKKLLKDQKLKKLPDIINIKQEDKISLFIDYYTVFMYPNDDTLYYADDNYDYDNLILETLGSNKI